MTNAVFYSTGIFGVNIFIYLDWAKTSMRGLIYNENVTQMLNSKFMHPEQNKGRGRIVNDVCM